MKKKYILFICIALTTTVLLIYFLTSYQRNTRITGIFVYDGNYNVTLTFYVNVDYYYIYENITSNEEKLEFGHYEHVGRAIFIPTDEHSIIYSFSILNRKYDLEVLFRNGSRIVLSRFSEGGVAYNPQLINEDGRIIRSY